MGALGKQTFDTLVPAGERRRHLIERMTQMRDRGMGPMAISRALAVYEDVELSDWQVYRQLRRLRDRRETTWRP